MTICPWSLEKVNDVSRTILGEVGESVAKKIHPLESVMILPSWKKDDRFWNNVDKILSDVVTVMALELHLSEDLQEMHDIISKKAEELHVLETPSITVPMVHAILYQRVELAIVGKVFLSALHKEGPQPGQLEVDEADQGQLEADKTDSMKWLLLFITTMVSLCESFFQILFGK